jgi:hypothetical protein
MGLLEKIDAKLSLICIALNIDTSSVRYADGSASAPATQSAPAVAGQLAEVAAQSAAALQVNTVPTTTAPAVSTPVVRKTVAEVLAAGGTLTGHELDAQGTFWCAKINTVKPAVTQKNVWKRGKGLADDVYDARLAEIKAIVASESAAAPATAPATSTQTFPAVVGSNIPATTAAVPGVPGVPGIPAVGALPGVPGVPGVQGYQSSLEDKTRKEIIQFANVLHNKYAIDYGTVGMLYNAFGSADHTFAGVPDASYPQLHEALNKWSILLDRVEEADKAVLALLNGANGTYLIDILSQLNLGTNNLTTVFYADLPKVYMAVHQYLNALETHFSRPLTPAKAV